MRPHLSRSMMRHPWMGLYHHRGARLSMQGDPGLLFIACRAARFLSLACRKEFR